MLKIGDKVRIKSLDEITNIERSKSGVDIGPGFNPDLMGRYCGEKTEIIRYHDYNFRPNWVILDIDEDEWVWDVRWLELIQKNNMLKLSNDLFEI